MMKSNFIKNLLKIGITIVSIFIIIDIATLFENKEEAKKEFSKYLEFENSIIDEMIAKRIIGIQNSIHFKDDYTQKLYQPFQNINTNVLNTVLKNLVEIFDNNYNLIESYPYFSSLEDAYNRMNFVENTEIKNHFQKKFDYELITLLFTKVVGWGDCGFFNTYKGIKPITEDSIYIGSLVYPDYRSKFAFQINGVEVEESECDCYEYLVPTSDTLNITTLYYSYNFISIDTFTHHQTIANINGDWKYIGSD